MPADGDVGFGRSSLEVLLATEPQVVKIDRGYVHGVHKDPERLRLLQRFIGLIRGIKAVAVAEGIELRQDLVALQDMGIEMGQGWLWGKPGS